MTQRVSTRHLVVIEWTGSLLGLLGAFLLATNSTISGFGFIAFLLSNVCWIACAIHRKVGALFVMQMGFMATSILGIMRWLA